MISAQQALAMATMIGSHMESVVCSEIHHEKKERHEGSECPAELRLKKAARELEYWVRMIARGDEP
jgi:hypothetical protein